MAILKAVNCYPVKGLDGIELNHAELVSGKGLPNDRRYAVTNGLPADYDGVWMQASFFASRTRQDGLTDFALSFDQKENLVITTPDEGELSVPLNSSLSAQTIDKSKELFSLLELPREPAPAQLTEHYDKETAALWDHRDSAISIINLQTVRAVSESCSQNLDPARFRGNLMVDDLPAWEEFSWLGRKITIGECELEIIRPIDRCPATTVNPSSGARDFDLPVHLQETYGHVFCGMYARVVRGGRIKSGDPIEVDKHHRVSLEQVYNPDGPAYALWPRPATVVETRDMGSIRLLVIEGTGPWALQQHKDGQRARFHLGPNLWTGTYVEKSGANKWMFEIEPKQTEDAATTHLAETTRSGDILLVSGPYGRGRYQ